MRNRVNNDIVIVRKNKETIPASDDIFCCNPVIFSNLEFPLARIFRRLLSAGLKTSSSDMNASSLFYMCQSYVRIYQQCDDGYFYTTDVLKS